jgi:hypothetical protein
MYVKRHTGAAQVIRSAPGRDIGRTASAYNGLSRAEKSDAGRATALTSSLTIVTLSRATSPNPFVDFGQLELPELADFSRGQTLPLNPSIHRVLRYTQVLRQLVDGNPRLC